MWSAFLLFPTVRYLLPCHLVEGKQSAMINHIFSSRIECPNGHLRKFRRLDVICPNLSSTTSKCNDSPFNPVKCAMNKEDAGCIFDNFCQAKQAIWDLDNCLLTCPPEFGYGTPPSCTHEYDPHICGWAKCEYSNSCTARYGAGFGENQCYRKYPWYHTKSTKLNTLTKDFQIDVPNILVCVAEAWFMGLDWLLLADHGFRKTSIVLTSRELGHNNKKEKRVWSVPDPKQNESWIYTSCQKLLM